MFLTSLSNLSYSIFSIAVIGGQNYNEALEEIPPNMKFYNYVGSNISI